MNIPPPDSSFTQSYDSAPIVSADDRTMAMLAYILGIFTGFLGPLILWLVKKDQSKFVGFHSLQALLLHAAVTIGYLVSTALFIVFIGFLTMPVFGLLSLVFSIIAGLAANRGEWYDIPVIGPIARQQSRL